MFIQKSQEIEFKKRLTVDWLVQELNKVLEKVNPASIYFDDRAIHAAYYNNNLPIETIFEI